MANALYWQVQSAFPHLCAAATDQNDTVVATGRAVAFALDSPGRGALPDGGLDRIMIWAMNDRLAGVQPDIASAVEIAIGRAHQRTGLSHRMLRALRDAVRAAGLPRLVAPVRPNAKHRHPRLPMPEYIAMLRDDGLPVDPWLRVHVRVASGQILHIACAPLLAAEVFSPTSRLRDASLKKAFYARLGVRSYWLVDPVKPALTAFELRSGTYTEIAYVAGDQVWQANDQFGVAITPADLIRGV